MADPERLQPAKLKVDVPVYLPTRQCLSEILGPCEVGTTEGVLLRTLVYRAARKELCSILAAVHAHTTAAARSYGAE